MPSTPVAGGSTGRPRLAPGDGLSALQGSTRICPLLSSSCPSFPRPSPSSPPRTWRVCGWPAPGDGGQLPLLLSGALGGQAQSTGPPSAPTPHVTAEDAWCQGGRTQGQPGASWSQDRDPLLRRKGPGERSDRQGRAGRSAWRIRGQDFQLHVGARHGLHPGPGLQLCWALRVAELRCPPPGTAACTNSDTQPGWHSPNPPHDPGLRSSGFLFTKWEKLSVPLLLMGSWCCGGGFGAQTQCVWVCLGPHPFGTMEWPGHVLGKRPHEECGCGAGAGPTAVGSQEAGVRVRPGQGTTGGSMGPRYTQASNRVPGEAVMAHAVPGTRGALARVQVVWWRGRGKG